MRNGFTSELEVTLGEMRDPGYMVCAVNESADLLETENRNREDKQADPP